MFDSKEIAERALRMAGLLRAQRKRRRERLVTAAMITACLSLAVCVAVLPGWYDGTGPPPAQASVSIYDGAVVGGYVIAGLIGFSLGTAVTLLCLRKMKKMDKRRNGI